MDAALVAVARFVVATARREVDAAGDLFVEQDVLHRLRAIRVEADRELANVAGAFVCIQNLVQLLRGAAGGFYDFAILEDQPNVVVGGAAVDGGGVEVDDAVHALTHGRGEDFAIRDVHLAVAGDRGDALDAEGQIRVVRPLQAHLVGRHHPLGQRLHRLGHLAVVHRADIEVVILERLGAHLGHLRHRRARPAQHAPARLGDPHLAMHFLPDGLLVELLLVGRDVGQFRDVRISPCADVAVGLLHLPFLDVGDDLPLCFRPRHHERPLHLVGFQQHDRQPAGLRDSSDDRVRERVRHIDRLQQQAFAGLHFAGVVDEQIGQLGDTGVGHSLSGHRIGWSTDGHG